MFNIHVLNNANESAKIKASRLLKEGLVKVISRSDSIPESFIKDLRDNLEQTFIENGYPPHLNINNIKGKKIQQFIMEYLTNNKIKNLFEELSKKGGGEVTIFPLIHLMRNYFQVHNAVWTDGIMMQGMNTFMITVKKKWILGNIYLVNSLFLFNIMAPMEVI